jgi:hypothetical protein
MNARRFILVRTHDPGANVPLPIRGGRIAEDDLVPGEVGLGVRLPLGELLQVTELHAFLDAHVLVLVPGAITICTPKEERRQDVSGPA